jgi:hypothetical protein
MSIERGRGTLGRSTPDPVGGIDSLASLRVHLQWAIELEHATLPSYLCAFYSLDLSRNTEVADVVHSVFLEEMLHLALAANLLNAVGGRPALDTPQMLPPYPRQLPHSHPPIEVPLVPFGREALELFLQIERPCAADAPPQSDGYETIGQFYEAIRRGLMALCDRIGESVVFCGDRSRQLADATFRGGPGRIFKVHDLSTALAALDLIVRQGEGAAHVEVWDGDHDMFHADRDEVGHYYRFREILAGRRFRRGDTPLTGPTGEAIAIDWDAIRPMVRNPRIADHAPGSPIRSAQHEFNITYCTVLHGLERTFNGQPEQLGAAIGAMYGLKAHAAALMQMATEDGKGVAGPTFEYVAPTDRHGDDRA